MHRLPLSLAFLFLVIAPNVIGQTWRAIPQQLDGFAFTLSGDGNTLLVTQDFPGELQRYEWRQGSWHAEGQPIRPDSIYGYYNNANIALDGKGDRMLVTATRMVDSQLVQAVHAFHWQSNKWLYRGTLFESHNPSIPVALSFDGMTAAISDARSSDSLTLGGVIDVFTWEQNSWKSLGNRIIGTKEYENLGVCFSLSGDGQHIVANDRKGRIYVYSWSGQQWVMNVLRSKQLPVWGGPWRAFDFNYDGSILAVGEYNSVSTSADPGRVWVVERQMNNWITLGDTINGTSTIAYAGHHTYINPAGNQLMISMPGNPEDDQIKQYHWTGHSWQLAHTVPGDFNNAPLNYPFFAVNDSMDRLVRFDKGKIATYILDTLTTIESMPSRSDVQLFPNPASHSVVLSWDAPGIVNCQVYDPMGRVQWQRTCQGCRQMTLSTVNWAAGLYPILLEINGKSIRKKLLVIQE